MEKIEEVWRDIVNCEGYQVSIYGRVRSVDHYCYAGRGRQRIVKGKILSLLKKGGWGNYKKVNLGYKKWNAKVHQLVAFAFPEICGEWFPGAEVDHIDGNPANNVAWNLRWVDHTTNMNNPVTKKRFRNTPRIKNNPKVSKPVEQYTMAGEFVKEYPSVNEVQREHGWREGNIITGIQKNRMRYGYMWKYKNGS